MSMEISGIEFSEKGTYFEDNKNTYIAGIIIPLSNDDKYSILMTCYKTKEESRRVYQIARINLDTLEVEVIQDIERDAYSVLLDYCDRYDGYTFGYKVNINH